MIVGAEMKSALLVDRVIDGNVPFGNPSVDKETIAFDGKQVVVTRTYHPVDYAPIRAALVANIKAKASEIILSYCPQHRQANLTAWAAELALTFPGTKGADLDEPHKTIWLSGMAIWTNIKLIRAHSDVLEAEVAWLQDANLAEWTQHNWPVI